MPAVYGADLKTRRGCFMRITSPSQHLAAHHARATRRSGLRDQIGLLPCGRKVSIFVTVKVHSRSPFFEPYFGSGGFIGTHLAPLKIARPERSWKRNAPTPPGRPPCPFAARNFSRSAASTSLLELDPASTTFTVALRFSSTFVVVDPSAPTSVIESSPFIVMVR